MKTQRIPNIVIISDEHCGSQFGLCPSRIKLDGGGVYQRSPLQKKLGQYWEIWWQDYVPMLTKGEPYVVVNVGDTIDGRHHGATDQISQNLTDQVNIALEMLLPVISKAKGYYHLRGTEAHGGISGETEEELAQQLHAIPDELGNYSRWALWMEMGEELIHFCHHIGVTQSQAYEGTALNKELSEAWAEAGRHGDKPPTVIVRAHRHRQYQISLSGEYGMCLAIITPCWELKTPFSYRLALGRVGQPQIGGYVLRTGDEDKIYARYKVWRIEREKTVKI